MHELGLYGMLGCEILLLKMADTNYCLLCRRLWSEQAEYSVHLVGVNTLSAHREFCGAHREFCGVHIW